MKKSSLIFLLLLPFLLLSAIGCSKQPFLASSKSGDQAYEECHRLSEKKDYEKSIQCFELLKSRFAGSSAAVTSDLEIGDNYFRKGDYLLAADTYLAFIKLHPENEKVGYAYYRVGLSYMKHSPKSIARDQQYLEQAINYFERAIETGESDINGVAREKWREARTRVAQRQFYIGRFYYRTGEYISAIPRFQTVVTQYTGLGLDEKTLYLMGESYRRLSEKDKALEILGVFEQHFPQSRYRKKLASQIGVK